MSQKRNMLETRKYLKIDDNIYLKNLWEMPKSIGTDPECFTHEFS